MRIALVSPYSWSYQGGVNRHVEALAEEFLGRGHHVRVLAPLDPPGRLSRLSHRAAPESREPPEYLTPLGRTVGIAANGAVSNLSVSPRGGVLTPRLELRGGDFEIVHIHEPESACMMLDYIDEKKISSRIRKAIASVIEEGKVRTYDMMKMAGRPDVIQNGAASTSVMTEAIIARLM